MTTPQLLREIVSPALVRGVGYALLHSLWQGGALALLLAATLPLLRRHRAEVRYAVAAGALATLVLAVGFTFSFYCQSQPSAPAQWVAAGPAAGALAAPAGVAASAPAAAEAAPLAWLQANRSTLEAYLPLVVIAWLLGLLLMSGRLVGGLVYTNRLRQTGTQTLGAEWQRRLTALAQRAGVRRPVALLESARVAGPLVLGHLRPAILLPLGAVAGLSPALLEALLAHELAHIVRRDYLLNLGLAVTEVLFFYHPAVWFMANCLRAERENCCDDQAAALCGGDRLRVARALAALAELEAANSTPQLALAAAGTGGRGSLLARVRRLALGRPQAPTLGEGLLALLLGVLGIAGLGTGVALAAPASTKALLINVKQAIAPVDTTRKSKVANTFPGLPALPDFPALPALPSLPALPAFPAFPSVAAAFADDAPEAAATETDPETDRRPRVRSFSFAQPNPPRRASTVVIEKDKKGRVVSLLVDGQPVDTGAENQKARRKKKEKVRTVEVVTVPAPASGMRVERIERPERPENGSFSFNFSADGLTSQALREAQRGLAEAMRSPDLNDEQRQEMAQELRKLEKETMKLRAFGNGSGNNFQFNLDGNSTTNDPAHPRFHIEYSKRGGRLKFDKTARPGDNAARNAAQAERNAEQAARNAERAGRNAEQAGRNAEQAGRNAEQAGRNAELLAINSRRAELRARMAADAAELRALSSAGREQAVYSGPTTPQPPRAPRAPQAPAAPKPPQGPGLPPPPPPAPNTVKLREALRNDGLIKDEKHFSFELNDEGGRVNGQALTPAQAAKYRQLLKLPTTKIKGSKSNFGITVDEN